MSRHTTPAALVPDLRSLAERIDRLERGGGTNGFPSDGDFGTSQAMLEFPAITATTPTINAGSSWAGSFGWAALAGGRTILVRQFRIDPATPTVCDVKVLRQGDFSVGGLAANVAFEARECGEGFAREHIWDYTDEDESDQLHLWVHNTGNQATTFTVSLNHREPQ